MSIWTILAANTFSIICAAIAAVLLLRKHDQWGWFLFAAVICAASGPAVLKVVS